MQGGDGHIRLRPAAAGNSGKLMVAEEHTNVIGSAGPPANGRCGKHISQAGEHGVHPLVLRMCARVLGEHGFLSYQGGALGSSQPLAIRKGHGPTGNNGRIGSEAEIG